MKRKGYKDVQEQIEANKRYLDSNPDAKIKANRSRLKSTCYRFVRDFATTKELKNIKELIVTREETMEKMTKEKWEQVAKTIKGKTYKGYWQEEIEKICDSENPIKFGYIENLPFYEGSRFVECYEEEGEAGYLVLELTFNRSKDEDEVTIVDAWYRGEEELKILKNLYEEWRNNTEEALRDYATEDGFILRDRGSVDSAEGCVLDDFNDFLDANNNKPVTREEMEELEGEYNWEHNCTCNVKLRLTKELLECKTYIKEDGDYKVEIEKYKIVENNETTIDREDVGFIDEDDLQELRNLVEDRTEVLDGDFVKKVNILDKENDIIRVYYPALRD